MFVELTNALEAQIKITGCYRNDDGSYQMRRKYLWNLPNIAKIHLRGSYQVWWKCV
jgi:hypothetical protein